MRYIGETEMGWWDILLALIGLPIWIIDAGFEAYFHKFAICHDNCTYSRGRYEPGAPESKEEAGQ